MNNAARPYSLEGAPNQYAQMLAQPLWDSYSNKLYPVTLRDAMMWAIWLRSRHGDFTAAILRAIAYFLNGVDIVGDLEDSDSRDHFQTQLMMKHKIEQKILAVGLDLQFYGNSFSTAMLPITRTLKCPRCGTFRYLRKLRRGRDYDFNKGEFTTVCPSCKYNGVHPYVDYVDRASAQPLNVINWNPLHIDIDFCALTDAEKITYTPSKADRDFIDNIAQSVALETLPKLLLDATVNESAIEFNGDSCLHLATTSDAMNKQTMKGWGLPRFLTSFKYIIQLMLLERQTESVVKDFMLPIRLLFPDPATTARGSDLTSGAVHNINLGYLRSVIDRSLRSQALHQSSWQMIPTAVQQLTLGGDGKAIVPVDMLQYTKEQLLDTLCVPVEFYKSSLLSSQALPMSLRTFEQSWSREIEPLDDYLNWYLMKCQQLLGWPHFEGALMRQSVVFDPARINAMTELYQNKRLTEATYMRAMRIDPKMEARLRVEEAVAMAKEQQEISNRLQKAGFLDAMMNMPNQQAMDQAAMSAQGGDPAAQGGAPAGAGAAPPGGAQPMGGVPVASPMTGDPITDIQNLMSVKAPQGISMEQVQADAQVVAQILMKTPVGAPRQQIYTMVKQLNPTLYDVAKSALERFDNQARQQGLEMARQQG